MWDDVKTDKIVGLLAQNDPDGVAWADGSKKALGGAGIRSLISVDSHPEPWITARSSVGGKKRM